MQSLMSPVPLTASKVGRPSVKRSRAAVEGVASRKVMAMIPDIGVGAVGGVKKVAVGTSREANTTISNAQRHSSIASYSSSSSAAAAAVPAAAGVRVVKTVTASGRSVVAPCLD